MDTVTPNTDPVLTEIVRNALDAIADEIALIVLRTACSGIVRDSMDYSTAVCDAAGGNTARDGIVFGGWNKPCEARVDVDAHG